MATVTLTVSEQEKAEFKSLAWVNWSEATAEELDADLRRQKALQKLDKMLEKSELTDEDCIRLGRELKERVWKRHKKEGW